MNILALWIVWKVLLWTVGIVGGLIVLVIVVILIAIVRAQARDENPFA